MTDSTLKVNTDPVISALNQADHNSKTASQLVSCASNETGTLSEKPTYLRPLFEKFPKELTDLDQWVVWKAKWDNDRGKWTKPLHNPVTGGYAKSNTPKTWSSFEVAKKAYESGDYDGVGFVLTREDGFSGLDLDHILTQEGIENKAQSIIETMQTYTEKSPSGDGVRMFCIAKLPTGGRKKGNYELYENGRYLTLTGHRMNESGIESRQSEIEKVHSIIFGKPQDSIPPSVSEPTNISDISDSDLLEKMFNSKNGYKIRDLFNGNIGDDHSYADASLCSHLAFWTGKDTARMDSLFRSSDLYREKWDIKHHSDGRTYGQLTIDKAICNCTEIYTPPKKRTAGTTTRSKSKAGQGPQIFNLTDFGNAERLIDRHGDNIKFSFEAGKWLVWNGKKWEFDNKGTIEQLSKETVRSIVDSDEYKTIDKEYKSLKTQQNDKENFKSLAESDRKKITKRIKELEPAIKNLEGLSKHAKNSENKPRINAMTQLARTEPGVTIDLDELDSSKWLFNCENGTIDLKTGQLKQHDRLDLNSKISPVKYDPAAACPLWNKFLDDVFQGDHDLIDFMQRSVGYALTGDTREEVFWVLHGTGGNGKGTFIHTLMKIFADFGKTTDFTATFATPVYKQNDSVLNHLATLKGARLVSASESEENATLSEAVVKNTTAPDSGKITGRFKFQNPFEYTPEFKIFLATNHKPKIKGNDEGIWRRVMLIPFNQTFRGTEKDDKLKDKLQAELPGIFKWAIEGCLKWQSQGLNPPSVVLEATAEYRQEMDLLSDFFDECCEIDPLVQVSVKEIYEAYLIWNSGVKPLGKKKFGAELEKRGFEKKRSNGIWSWLGLKVSNAVSNGEFESTPEGLDNTEEKDTQCQMQCQIKNENSQKKSNIDNVLNVDSVKSVKSFKEYEKRKKDTTEDDYIINSLKTFDTFDTITGEIIENTKKNTVSNHNTFDTVFDTDSYLIDNKENKKDKKKEKRHSEKEKRHSEKEKRHSELSDKDNSQNNDSNPESGHIDGSICTSCSHLGNLYNRDCKKYGCHASSAFKDCQGRHYESSGIREGNVLEVREDAPACEHFREKILNSSEAEYQPSADSYEEF